MRAQLTIRRRAPPRRQPRMRAWCAAFAAQACRVIAQRASERRSTRYHARQQHGHVHATPRRARHYATRALPLCALLMRAARDARHVDARCARAPPCWCALLSRHIYADYYHASGTSRQRYWCRCCCWSSCAARRAFSPRAASRAARVTDDDQCAQNTRMRAAARKKILRKNII